MVLNGATPDWQRRFRLDPDRVTRPSLSVELIPVNYTDETGDHCPVSISETTRQGVEATLRVVYPVAAVAVTVCRPGDPPAPQEEPREWPPPVR